MVIIPLVVFSLICGMASIGDIRKLGRIGAKTIGYYLLTTLFACTIGLTLVNFIRPGDYITKSKKEELLSVYKDTARRYTEIVEKHKPDVWSFIRELFPRNPFEAMVRMEMLKVILFSLLFGLATTFLREELKAAVIRVISSLNEVMIKMVDLVMQFAPVGVFCLIGIVTSTTGLSVLGALGVYCLTVLGGLLLQVLLVYFTILKLSTPVGFFNFLRCIRPAQLTAFATSSSAATLPVNMRCVNKNLGVSNDVVSFVLPLGATMNMDGTVIMQAVASVFIAQVYGFDLGLAGQLTILLTATLASIGTAAVPGAGIAMLIIILTPLGIPAVGIALILGVDRILDMCRTVVNITGDAVGASFVASTEGESLKPA
jgi:Na+/H+-dicarboxylate symporter